MTYVTYRTCVSGESLAAGVWASFLFFAHNKKNVFNNTVLLRVQKFHFMCVGVVACIHTSTHKYTHTEISFRDWAGFSHFLTTVFARFIYTTHEPGFCGEDLEVCAVLFSGSLYALYVYSPDTRVYSPDTPPQISSSAFFFVLCNQHWLNTHHGLCGAWGLPVYAPPSL